MKKILVPTDFSAWANYATEAALQIAKKSDSELLFLHMMGVPSDWMNMNLNERSLYKSVNKSVSKANAKLDELVNRAGSEGVKATKYLQYHVSFKDMTEYIRKIGADLIVMGSHGVTGLGELLVGSNTQKMVRFCDIPLLVINKKPGDLNIKKIVYATDLDPEHQSWHKSIKSLIKLFDAKLIGLFVNTPYSFKDTPFCEKLIKKFTSLDDLMFDSFRIYNYRNVEEGILQFSKEMEADMIIMITSGKTGLSRALERSVTESVIRYAKRPVLSLKESA